MLAARWGAVCVGGATFHVVRAGVADLPAVGGQMVVVMGRRDSKDAQQSCGIVLVVQHCLLSVGYGRAEQHLLPQIGIKAWYGKKCGMVNHRGNLVVLAEEAKVLCAVGATYIVTASLFCSQSPLERKWGWRGWVGVLRVRGVNGMET